MDFLGFNRQLETSLQMLQQESVDECIDQAGLPSPFSPFMDNCDADTETHSTEPAPPPPPPAAVPSRAGNVQQKQQQQQPAGSWLSGLPQSQVQRLASPQSQRGRGGTHGARRTATSFQQKQQAQQQTQSRHQAQLQKQPQMLPMHAQPHPQHNFSGVPSTVDVKHVDNAAVKRERGPGSSSEGSYTGGGDGSEMSEKPASARRNKKARLNQNAEAQRRYRERLKLEKNTLKDVADTLANRSASRTPPAQREHVLPAAGGCWLWVLSCSCRSVFGACACACVLAK